MNRCKLQRSPHGAPVQSIWILQNAAVKFWNGIFITITITQLA
jgi:hypothetical protein